MEFLQPGIGDEVWVRRRRWTIRAADVHPGCRVLTLQLLSNTGASLCTRVIQPFDDIHTVTRNTAPSSVGPRRWQTACRALVTEDGGADSLLTAADAAIELLPFQLEPAIAFLKGLGTRVLIADDVGLGKTVQAMLTVAELRARGLATRVLIVCPAGLRDQWAEECARRFSLSFSVADHGSLRRAAAQLPHDVPPWTTQPLSIVSVDYLKRPEVLSAALSVPWDLVIVDEAHGSCGLSERQDAVAQLSARTPYVILLTATPHNGDFAAFNALCAIGSHDDRLLVFRRSKREVGYDCERRIHINRITPTEPERRMHGALAALTAAIRRERGVSDSPAWLVLSVLHKRALSGGHALATSVARRLTLLGGMPDESATQLGLPLAGDEDVGTDAPPMWSEPALRDLHLERALLDQLLAAATDAARADSKVGFLTRLLARLQEPVIVFTEYRDTLLDLRERLGRDAAVIHGGLSRSERQSALAQFRSRRLLLATDAAGEGLNLHEHCRTIINFELPWNPMRLEQRIGRVDRIGQRRRVHIVHLVSASTGETQLLRRLVSRVRRAQRSIPTPNPLGNTQAWTETDSARLVIFADSGGDPTRQLQPGDGGSAATEPAATRSSGQPQIRGLRLTAEGEREALRASFVRHVDARRPHRRDGGIRSSSQRGPLVARTMRPKLRRILGGRSLAIYRVSVADAFGRRLATRILGLVPNTSATALHIDWCAADMQDAARRLLADATAGWFDEAVTVHANACSAQVARLSSIVHFVERHPRGWQPGLFDHRVAHERARDDAERGRALETARLRLLQIEESARSCTRTFELVLIAGITGRHWE